jgi:tRNA pseudouridine65 synthase
MTSTDPADLPPDSFEDEIEFFPEPLDVLYHDEHFIAVDKPPGLLVHRAERTPREETVLLQKLRDQIGQFLYPIHRLDRPTSGLIIFGLSSEAAAAMVDVFTRRLVTKRYRALVRGYLYPTGKIDLPLRERFGEDRPSYQLSQHPEQEAVTRYQTLQWFEAPWSTQCFPTTRYAYVELQPETGRWHQLRRHLNHISHPILGDKRHGDNRHNHIFEQVTGVRRMLLTAFQLDFVHPFTQQPITIQANLSKPFQQAMQVLEAHQVEMNLAHLPPQPDSQRA